MKLENETLIPLNNEWGGDWLDYNKSIYLIRKDEDGNIANFQFDGCACAQGFIKGYVHSQFKSKGKWFNPDWWYKKTAWGSNYPSKLYFNKDRKVYDYVDLEKLVGKSKKEISESINKFEKITEEMANAHARPSENILSNIIKTAEKKTGIDIDIDFPDGDTDYGVNWWESYIPVKFGNKLEYSGILTWENCD